MGGGGGGGGGGGDPLVTVDGRLNAGPVAPSAGGVDGVGEIGNGVEAAADRFGVLTVFLVGVGGKVEEEVDDKVSELAYSSISTTALESIPL